MAITDLANSLKAQGKNIIGLAAGEPDFDTPEIAQEAGINAIQNGFTHYGPNVGYMDLRSAICEKLLKENGLKYDADCVVVSNGAKQSIWQAVVATCGPEDEVIIPAPYWVSYPEMVKLAGAKPVVVETTVESGFILQEQQLVNAITEKTRMIILCTPSNPTGAVYSREQLETVARIVSEFPNILVLSDEIYEYIIYQGYQHTSFGSLPGMWERTLTVNGFSKAFAMTGWRMGYLAAPAPLAKACASVQSHTTSGASSIAQKASLAALQQCQNDVQYMREQFEIRKTFVIAQLQQIKGLKFVSPGGAFYVLIDVFELLGGSVGDQKIQNVEQLSLYLLEDALVAVVPGDAFGAPTCIRISFAVAMETLQEAMERIKHALNKIQFQ